MTTVQETGKKTGKAQLRSGLTRLPCLLLSIALVLLGTAQALAIDEGDPAPVFDAPTLSGKGTISLDQYRGKIVYLDFWASWCPPCLESLPQIERLHGAFPKDQFQIVAVNVDKKPEKALQFLKRNPVSYPSASDPQGLLPKRYGLQTMPTSFLIDRSGIVRYVHNGFRRGDIDELHARIKKMLAEP